MKIGAQLYTVRDFCQNLDDFAETLKKIADIGYESVQVSGTCPYEAKWLQEQLKKNGLICAVTHNPPDKIINETQKVIDDHTIFDCDRIGLGWYGFNNEMPYENFISTYKPIAATIKENGKYFMYHNHDGEFQKIGGKTILCKLAEDFNADELGFILDTYWIQAGGGDPAQYVEMMSGRIPCIHLKDFSYGRKMEVIGEGNINFDRVFEKAAAGGTEYMLVEQDNCNGENPFDCLKRSYEFLKSRGF